MFDLDYKITCMLSVMPFSSAIPGLALEAVELVNPGTQGHGSDTEGEGNKRGSAGAGERGRGRHALPQFQV